MPENEEEIQEIIKEFFERQENSKLKLCIYEEKASNDLEWFYDGYDWCYLKTKKYKEKIGDEVFNGTKFIIEKKRIKTFGKKCHIISMSFDNFMAIDYMQYKNVDEADTETVHSYANNFMKIKKEKEKENIVFTLDDYHKYLTQEQIRIDKETKQGCINVILWIITIIFVFVCFPVAIFTCPLTWKLVNKIRGKIEDNRKQ